LGVFLQLLGWKKREMLQSGLDCGFGEENSLEFGFMNVAR
jgi:CRISPR/Cas system endoribonuclease Cas6 (RAMP superfamily)